VLRPSFIHSLSNQQLEVAQKQHRMLFVVADVADVVVVAVVACVICKVDQVDLVRHLQHLVAVSLQLQLRLLR